MKTNLWLTVLTIALVLNMFMMRNTAEGDAAPGIRKEHLNPAPGAFVDDKSIVIDGTEGLKVKVDNQTIEIDDNGLQIKDDEYFYAREEYPNNTSPGNATGSGTWNTRVFNTLIANTISGASIAANRITLPAGTYRVEASAPAHYVGYHQCRLKSISGTNINAIGTSQDAGSANLTYDEMTRSHVKTYITLDQITVLELQHECTGAGYNGLGQPANLGNNEVFAEIEIQKMR